MSNDPNIPSDNSEKTVGRPPLAIFFQLLANPVQGWKAIWRSTVSPDRFARDCFYPLIALAAVSCFVQLLYPNELTLSIVLQKAIVIFVSYFASYFCIQLIASKVLSREVRPVIASPFGKKFVMAALGSLAFFQTLYLLLPMLEAVLVFLPIYTLYLVVRGVKYLRVPKEKELVTICWLEVLIIGVPLLLGFGLLELMPAV